MVRKMRILAVSFLATVAVAGCKKEPVPLVTPDDPARQISEAQLLYDHGLVNEAKQALFGIYRDEKAEQEHRSEALYWLASIAANEGRYAVAAQDLQRLTKEFPQSKKGKDAAAMLSQFQQVITDINRKEVTSPVAEAYMRNGDFWARDAQGFTIDSSWLPKEDMAVEWYDRVIRQFPKTEAAEEAYSKKISTLLGWEDRGVYSTTKFGARRDSGKYMTAAIAAFEAMARDFPESGYLQGLRYQIAQAYWIQRKWDSAREWLNKIVAAPKSEGDFYVHLAQNRLRKLEW